MEKDTETKVESIVETTDILNAARTALVLGKRHLLIKDIPQAVTTLGDACRLFSETVGIFSIHSADAHYYYGKSLLENARTDLNVFQSQPGGANNTKSGEEDSEEEDEDMEEDEEEDPEGELSSKTKEEAEAISADGSKKTENLESESKVKNGHKSIDAEDLKVPSPKVEVNSTVGEPISADSEKTEGKLTLGESEEKVRNGHKEPDVPKTVVSSGTTVDDEAEVPEAKTKDVEKEEMSVDADETENKKSTTVDGENRAEVTDTNNADAPIPMEDEDLDAPSPQTEVKPGTSVGDDEKPSTSSGTGGEGDPDVTVPEDDEPTNLELAWEVLEVSKVSYTRLVEEVTQKLSEAKESNKTDEEEELKKTLQDYRNKMALVHSMLGEVATESEQYAQAVEEINTALAILRENEEYDNREIAQCYFQLGIAHSFDKKFADAIASFKKAVELIETRIEDLEKKTAAAVKSGNENGEEGESKNPDVAEIEELKALLPELQEKINDTLDAEKDAVQVNEEEKQEQELILRASPVKNPNPPIVNDISHLVKKKKKAEDLPEEEPPSKKICTEPDSTSKCSNGENVDHDAVNGSTVKAE